MVLKVDLSLCSLGVIFSDQVYTLQNLHIVLESLVKADTPESKDSAAHAWFVLDMGNDV